MIKAMVRRHLPELRKLVPAYANSNSSGKQAAGIHGSYGGS
jgi:hypothetical protein